MEHLKNVGTGALALAFTILFLAGILLLGMLCLEALDVLARHWPGTGPALFVTAIALAILWVIGRSVRRKAA